MTRLFAGLLAAPLLLSVPAYAQDVAPLETMEQRFSYIVGLQLGQRMVEQGMGEQLDVDAFAQAIRDVFSRTPPRLSQEEMDEAIKALREAAVASQANVGEEAMKTGVVFLAENKAKPGVVTTDSGIQYEVTEMGEGPKPTASDTVKVHYEGRLLDGTVFDSSYARNDPATFGVGQVIQGWQEALQLMPVGSKWEVWIPSDLAYGPAGAGGAIGPNETLNFTIELLEIVEK